MDTPYGTEYEGGGGGGAIQEPALAGGGICMYIKHIYICIPETKYVRLENV